jgi:hypothetical protein
MFFSVAAVASGSESVPFCHGLIAHRFAVSSFGASHAFRALAITASCFLKSWRTLERLEFKPGGSNAFAASTLRDRCFLELFGTIKCSGGIAFPDEMHQTGRKEPSFSLLHLKLRVDHVVVFLAGLAAGGRGTEPRP